MITQSGETINVQGPCMLALYDAEGLTGVIELRGTDRVQIVKIDTPATPVADKG
jgi:hypothetical protein